MQYSVFECQLTEKKFWELYGKLTNSLQQSWDQEKNNDSEETDQEEYGAEWIMKDEKPDQWSVEDSSNSVRVYRLCANCVEQIQIIGVEKQKKEEQDIIII